MAASASAAGGEPQKQFLSIIRDFAAEKSHGERTVSGLKRRLDDVVSASDAATAELEAAKRAREAAETELRGSEVQASIADASIQALEATISHLQEEIAKLGSELEALKSTEDIEREEFLRQMHEMNARIRQFQQKASAELAERCSGPPSADGKQGKSAEGQHGSDMNETMDSEGMLTDSVDQMNNMNAEVHVLEEEYQKDLLELEKLRHELADVRAKRALMEAVMKETKKLQELGGRVAELENVHNSLAEELQKRYICPGCGTNNMAAAEEEAAPAAAVAN
ncbi:uncharacterized protein LOC119335376 [Triticum dicoccoides]|uniref:uncharacterized protein LOC119335376 n=1 Tax=Triticum dicoccoides TaxID=85692 RepID=UPI0018912490|nr:uncharacterized protein LOC119335376 [Triticum dicoccoides]